MSMESIPEFRPPEPPEDDSLDQSLRMEVTAIALANVKTIQALTSEKLPEFASNLIPQHHMPTSAYMNALSPSERAEVLLAWFLGASGPWCCELERGRYRDRNRRWREH